MTERELVTGDVHLVRQVNRGVILKLIRDQGPISRVALSRRTSLTPATTSSIVEELVQDRLVVESGIGPSAGGRRPVLFGFSDRGYEVVGVSIRSAEVMGLVTDLRARPLKTLAQDYDPRADVDVVALTVGVIRQLIQSWSSGEDRLLGIGVSVPGLIDVRQGVVVESRNWNWVNLPLRDILADEFDLPIHIETDDKALALGEAAFGAGQGLANVVCVKLGPGVGAAIIADGELVRGSDNMAGEIAHMMVDPDGPRCYCGNYGCLAALVSATAITERAAKGIRRGVASLLNDQTRGEVDRITVAAVVEAAEAGDPFARQLVRETGRYLGIAIATLVNLLNPDRVIIGGGVIEAGCSLIEPTREVVRRRTHRVPGRRITILPAEHGVRAPAIGAVTTVMMREGALGVRGLMVTGLG